MGPVERYIKLVYDNWRNGNSAHGKIDPCKLNPFTTNHWMIDYLFPEMLLVHDSYMRMKYKKNKRRRGMAGYSLESYNTYLRKQGYPVKYAVMFPCWFIPEEEVLRIMVETGIID